VVALPDEPGEAVCRCLVGDEQVRTDVRMEIGVSLGDGPREVYVVAVDHCTRLTATEARAAGRHLLSAAAVAESRGW
jgi:hypothetical protein